MGSVIGRLTGRSGGGREVWLGLSDYAPIYRSFLATYFEWGTGAETVERIDSHALLASCSPAMTFRELGDHLDKALASDALFLALSEQHAQFASLADRVPKGVWNVNVSTIRTLGPMVELEGLNAFLWLAMKLPLSAGVIAKIREDQAKTMNDLDEQSKRLGRFYTSLQQSDPDVYRELGIEEHIAKLKAARPR